METTSTFVTMLEQFIDELELTFPTETKIKVYRNSFEMMRKTNPRKLVSLFVDTVSPYSAQISPLYPKNSDGRYAAQQVPE